MERFIVEVNDAVTSYEKFKIQYGEIYSINMQLKQIVEKRFKIQYGEIYRLTLFAQFYIEP